MTTIALISYVLAYSVALRRLLSAATPLFGFVPDRFQPYLAAALAAVPALIGALSGAESNVDLAVAFVVSAGAFGTALRGPTAVMGVVFGAAALTATPACSALRSAPAVSPANLYQAAVTACRVYDLLPPDKREPDADKACAELRRVCPSVSEDIAPMPDAGVEPDLKTRLEGAAGAEAL